MTTAYNDPEKIKAWLEADVFAKCALSQTLVGIERKYLQQMIEQAGWRRGNVSEHLRDKYGRECFLNCNLYL